MPKIPYSVLAPLVRALLTRVDTRPAPAAFVDPWLTGVGRQASGPEDDDAPPTQRRAA